MLITIIYRITLFYLKYIFWKSLFSEPVIMLRCAYRYVTPYCFLFTYYSEIERRIFVSQRQNAQQPWPECRASRFRSSGRLSKVLRMSQRYHPQGTRMFSRRSFQRRIPKVWSARKRARMVSILLFHKYYVE